MRKFRNAALAAATATALTFGGTSVAVAEEGTQAPKAQTSSTFISGSTRNADGDAKLGDIIKAFFQEGPKGVGKLTGADQQADFTKLWGANVDDEGQPQWALLWRDGVNWLGLLSGIGIVIALGNAALHEGLLPQIKF